MFKTKDWRLSDLFRTDGTDSVFFRQIRVFINTCKVHLKEIWEKVHPCCLCVLRKLFSSRLTQLSLFYPTETWLWMFTCSIPPYYGTCVSSLPWLFFKDYTVQNLWIHTQVCLYCCSVISSPLRINTPWGRNWNFLMTYSSYFFNIPLILQFNTK